MSEGMSQPLATLKSVQGSWSELLVHEQRKALNVQVMWDEQALMLQQPGMQDEESPQSANPA